MQCQRFAWLAVFWPRPGAPTCHALWGVLTRKDQSVYISGILVQHSSLARERTSGGAPRAAETYDLVSVQLYESFSHADFAISVEKARFPAQVPSPSPVAHASRDLQGTHRSGAPLPSRSKPRHICCILCER